MRLFPNQELSNAWGKSLAAAPEAPAGAEPALHAHEREEQGKRQR